jgi:hypothetical protein
MLKLKNVSLLLYVTQTGEWVCYLHSDCWSQSKECLCRPQARGHSRDHLPLSSSPSIPSATYCSSFNLAARANNTIINSSQLMTRMGSTPRAPPLSAGGHKRSRLSISQGTAALETRETVCSERFPTAIRLVPL